MPTISLLDKVSDMGLKRQIKYQTRVLLPLVALIWIIVIVLGVWMYNTERRLRVENIRTQVDLIGARILDTYEKNVDPTAFLGFVEDFYSKDRLFDEIRVSVYNGDSLICAIGDPIDLPSAMRYKGSELVIRDADEIGDSHDNFYYRVIESNFDKDMKVYTVLPFSNELIQASRVSTSIYLMLITVALFATFIAYIMAHRMGHTIRVLRDFALRAGSDPTFVPSSDFTHDELGDIARQIIRFYNDRNRSLIKLKREHKVAMRALEEKTRIKRDLTNNINHELKTPIGVIKGYLDTINANPDMDEESRRRFLGKVSEHVDRLIQLLEDLSSITRLEDGSQMINTEPVDFHEIVFQTFSDLEDSGVMGEMELNYDIPIDCSVVGNAALLSAMLGNLAKNSVAYSKGTECNLVLTGKDPDYFYFAFYDDGVGVKEESLPHLFERFFREDSGRSRKKGGTGLGLCIVQNTVEALGGTISAENREGGGLMFRFSLRRIKPA